MAVNIAARIGALADSGKVFVSGTLRDLVVGSDIEFVDRGEHSLKGVPGDWKVFEVTERYGQAVGRVDSAADTPPR
jgi:class 3 adenylate cyclase